MRIYVFFASITVNGNNNVIRFKEDGVAKTATIAAGTYYASGSLLTAIVAALNAAGAGNWSAALLLDADASNPAATVTFTVTGLTSAQLLLGDALTTFNSNCIGFNNQNTSTALQFIAGSSADSVWLADVAPSKDDLSRQRKITQTTAENGKTVTTVRGNSYIEVLLEFTTVHPNRVLNTAADEQSSLENWLLNYGDGRQIEVYTLTPDADDILEAPSTGLRLYLKDYVLAQDTLELFRPVRLDAGVNVYGFSIRLIEAVNA